MKPILAAALALVLATQGAWALGSTNCSANPMDDPEDDPCNPLKYIPSLPLNAVFLVLYFLSGTLMFYQTWRWGPKWFLAEPIGAYCMAIGFILRLLFRTHSQSIGIYAICNLFITLSPCAFLAADYVVLGRLVGHLDAARHLKFLKWHLAPTKVRKVFVWSDVVTFLIQASGGGLSATASSNPNMATWGSRLFLIGLILQLISFAFFTIICLHFLYSVYRARNVEHLWYTENWKTFYSAILFTCVCILVRSVFRCIEMSEGYQGNLTIHEKYFMLADALPLWIGITTYVIFWPGRWFDKIYVLSQTGSGTSQTLVNGQQAYQMGEQPKWSSSRA